MPQFVPRPGASSALASGEPTIRASAPAAIGLGQLATAAHAAVGDDRDVSAGLGQVRVTGRRDVADRRDLRNTDPEDLAGRARGAGPDTDEDRRRALLHEGEGRLGVRRVADRDRDRHVAGEVLERQRVVVRGQVAGAADLALDEEQVGAVLGTERAEAAGGAGRGGHGGLAPGGVDGRQPGGDEVLADRLLVDLGEEPLDLVVRRGGDPLEQRVRIVVASLDAFEVEDGQAAEAGEFAGHPRVHDRIHRGGQDRDREVDAAEGLGEVDVRRFDGVRARGERDVLEPVGRSDGVDLGVEDASRRRL